MRLRTSRLGYYERSGHKFRDYRDIEFTHNKKFARVTINGQYRQSKADKATTRYANPGWAFGTNHVYIEWVHHRRLCWHLSFNAYRKGVTFSYGRSLF